MADAVASLLRAIPAPGDIPAPLSTLCQQAELSAAQGVPMLEGVLILLQTLGVVEVSRPLETGEATVRSATTVAARFLSSLAEYLDADLTVLRHWDSAVLGPPLYSHQSLWGAQFLHLMERQRAVLDLKAPELHRVHHAVVIVKARMSWSSARYLVRYDPTTRGYQLPGGIRLPADGDTMATAVRELEAELPAFQFDPDRDQLLPLETIVIREVPVDYGVITGFELSFFQFQSTRSRLPIGPTARWAPRKALFSRNMVMHRQTTLVKGLQELARRLPGGLDELAAGADISR